MAYLLLCCGTGRCVFYWDIFRKNNWSRQEDINFGAIYLFDHHQHPEHWTEDPEHCWQSHPSEDGDREWQQRGGDEFVEIVLFANKFMEPLVPNLNLSLCSVYILHRHDAVPPYPLAADTWRNSHVFSLCPHLTFNVLQKWFILLLLGDRLR